MSSRMNRILAIVLAVSGAVIMLEPAAADAEVVAKTNTKFCKIFKGEALIFEPGDVTEQNAVHADVLMVKASKTPVPSKFKKDLKKLQGLYEKVAIFGEDPQTVFAGQEAFYAKVIDRIQTYIIDNCI
jgi:hypothetical protein